MSVFRLRFVPLLLAWLFTPLAGWGAFQAYLQIEGIPGEAKEPSHAGWIEVAGVTNIMIGQALAAPPLPAGVSAGFSELTVLKHIDSASPKLMLACLGSTNIPQARLEFLTAAPNSIRFYEIVLSNVVVRSLASAGTAGSGGSTGPKSASPTAPELCRLGFGRISWTYTEFRPLSQLPTTHLSSYWDLQGNFGNCVTNFAVFKVTGVQKAANRVLLTWQGLSGKTYQVYSASQVDGAFQPLAEVSPVSDMTTSFTAPIQGAAMFFAVEEKP